MNILVAQGPIKTLALFPHSHPPAHHRNPFPREPPRLHAQAQGAGHSPGPGGRRPAPLPSPGRRRGSSPAATPAFLTAAVAPPGCPLALLGRRRGASPAATPPSSAATSGVLGHPPALGPADSSGGGGPAVMGLG